MCNACAVDEIELQQQRHVRTASSSTIHVAHAIAMWRTAHFTQQHQQQQWQVDDFATAAVAAAAPKLGFCIFAILSSRWNGDHPHKRRHETNLATRQTLDLLKISIILPNYGDL